jgi:hypothetical protein
MKRAFHIFWWNKKDGKESQELDILIVTDSIDKVFDIFRKNFPDSDPNLIQNIELMTSTVVIG